MNDCRVVGQRSSGRCAAWAMLAAVLLGGTTLLRAGVAPEPIEYNCQFTAPSLETAGSSVRLTVPGCGKLHCIGEPMMPFRTLRLVIPPDCTVERVEATARGETVELKSPDRVEYAGEPNGQPDRARAAFVPGANRRIYGSDSLYPTAPAELISVQRLAGYDVALVRLFPVQYAPASGRLLFSANWRVRLHLSPAPANSEPRLRSARTGDAASRVAAFVDNPQLVPSVEPLLGPGRTSSGPLFDYLLVTSGDLAPAFQPLVERKTQDGLAVKVVTMDAITATTPGQDVPEKIRNYIRQAYTEWGISYVLLGGGTAIIPCRYAYVSADLAPKDSYIPCDLYYACLDGSWNGNHDRHWGEPTDGESGGEVDLLAEVSVGRAPVRDVEQVRTFVEKTIRHESESASGPIDAVLMAGFLGDFPTGPCQGADIFNPLLPLLTGCQVKWLDDRPHKLPQWTKKEAVEALNQSPKLVLYSGYGTPDILMRIHSWELAELTNSSPFLACSVACNGAQFDHGKFWPDSFGETLINGSSHGAFAAVLNSRVGWFDPQYPWKFSGEFEAKLFEELLQRGTTSLGNATQRSKEDLIGQVETRGCSPYRWCYFGITLLGDPSVSWRGGAPTPAAVASSGSSPGQAPGTADFKASRAEVGPTINEIASAKRGE